jgi:hypothetical protein
VYVHTQLTCVGTSTTRIPRETATRTYMVHIHMECVGTSPHTSWTLANKYASAGIFSFKSCLNLESMSRDVVGSVRGRSRLGVACVGPAHAHSVLPPCHILRDVSELSGNFWFLIIQVSLPSNPRIYELCMCVLTFANYHGCFMHAVSHICPSKPPWLLGLKCPIIVLLPSWQPHPSPPYSPMPIIVGLLLSSTDGCLAKH